MKIFTVAFSAFGPEGASIMVGNLEAPSREAAERLAWEKMLEFLPRSAGFRLHSIVVDEFQPVRDFTHWEAA